MDSPDYGNERSKASKLLKNWLDERDRPFEAVDSLGRMSFVESLSHALSTLPTDRSVVTAVYGPWGSGKTWILERVVETLASYSSAIDVCRFSPWEFKSHDQILSEFFAAISEKIPPEGETKDLSLLWGRLEQMALIGSLGVEAIANSLLIGGALEGSDPQFQTALRSLTSTFPRLFNMAGTAAKKASKSIQERSLAETKKDLSIALQEKLSRPILVVIDDLDRLTHSEIQLIIRLLNTTANLPKLHYLIFGDRAQIAGALDDVCGKQGDRYLEKLVENSFQVPEPGENQIRLRIWEGIEKIAHNSNERAEDFSKKFSDFWDSFLKKRIRNYRDCHRLLRTLDFHAGALTHDGALEVDLIDLLGIDFLRVFDSSLYHRLASEPPTKLWSLSSLSTVNGNSEKSDSAKIRALIDASSLGHEIACGALLCLFPHLSSHVQRFIDENQLRSLSYRRSKSGSNPSLSINEEDRTEIYFRLNLHAGELPEAKVREASASSGDPNHLFLLLKQLKTKKWLTQFFGRCRSDPSLFPDGTAASNLLMAISTMSDDLEAGPGVSDDELHSAFQLSDVLIERMSKAGTLDMIKPAILDAGDVTLALALLEEIRHRSGTTFFEGAESPKEMIKLEEAVIDGMCDKLLPAVKHRFVSKQFMKGSCEASRAFRMAHALGPKRTEAVLQMAVDASSPQNIWDLAETIAKSMAPQLSNYWWTNDEISPDAAKFLLDYLCRFASQKFWSDFISSEEVHCSEYPLSDLGKAVKAHIKLTQQTKSQKRSEKIKAVTKKES